MKKLSLTLCAVVCAVAVFAAQAAYAAELSVFAAASMTESMNQIAEMYKKVDPNVKLVFNFDSSGTLKTQIEQGAECDIFISAGQKQMNQINDKFVLPGSRFNIVANRVVLIVPKGKNPTKISSFADVVTDKVKLIALGNSDVPVGQYSVEIFKNMGLWDKLTAENKITYASNVKEVLAQTAAAAVSCGVVYSTDAATSKAVQVVADAPKDTHKPIVYPAAILNDAKDKAAAEAFVKYLKSAPCSKVFKKIGFAIPEK
ncbi:MAG: molybdate ABC transporter substrate-binding protein [Cloacibacillus sp.]